MPEMSNKQRTATWTISGIATVVAGVIAVQAWAKDNFVTQYEAKEISAEQRVIHDKQYLSRMLDHNETKLELSEMRADRLRDIEELSPREERNLSRLEEDINYYEEQLRVIRNNLRLGE